MGVLEEMCMLHAVVVLCFCCWQGLANRSMRIQDVYVGAVPIPQFIKKWVGDGVVLLVTTPD